MDIKEHSDYKGEGLLYIDYVYLEMFLKMLKGKIICLYLGFL
jgi:hypothetical protein